ncbi:MAG: hypothetical protein U0L70_00525, partial [Ruminococcus sp.]|nr:hypothetical protein [Ruminococcus sp.]
MFKKAISLLLSLMLVVTTLSVTIVSVSAADSVYVVAGVPELCVNTWDPSPETSADNIMEAQEDGTYVKVYTDVAVKNDYQFKIVGDGANWYGIDGGNDNFTFNVKSVCDVTITFNPETLKTTVTGEGVEIPTELVIESMRAVGNGDGNWLNGVAWDPADDSNLMTEVSDKVYEITYTDLDAFDNYQVKFAANGSWAANWGGVYAGSGVESEAAFNSNDNITIEVPYELADVTLRLDLTNFDYASKSGAKFTVTVTDKTGGEETTVATEATEETTEATEETTVATEPETTEATTAATEAPKGLTVNATSNYFPAFSTFVKEGEEYVTVTYFLDSSKDMLNCQWELKYDPAVLQFDNTVNMNEAGDDLNLMPQVDDLVWNVIANEDGSQAGRIKANATKLKLYKFANKGAVPFVTTTFKVVGSGETTVDLFLDILTLSKLGSNFMTDPAEEEVVVDSGVINDTPTKPNRVTVPHAGLYDPVATNPVETEPVTEATTVATEPETTVATEPETTEPETTAPAGDAVYVVAGVPELCVNTWDPSPETSAENVMTDNGDGTFSKVYSAVGVMDSYQLKVVENIGEAQNWVGIGPEYNDNFTFNVVEECDVTVTYEPATKTITVTGTGVVIPTELVIESMRAVGNGDGNWLNGVAWDPADDSNLMTEVSDKVYEITYTDLDAFDNYQVKFAANGSWAANWGGVYAGSGVESEAAFNSNDNITVEVPYELADVTLRLDLTNFDFASKTGAKFTVTVTDKTPATEPETTVPETTVPETTVPETTVPATGLNIKATSNYFPEANYTLTEADGTDLVTVTYYFDSAKQLLNTQWTLKFDPAVLSALPENNVAGFMPFATKGAIYETPAEGVIKGSASDLGLYDIKDGQAFVQVTFKALTFTGDTVVDLFVEDLTVSERNAEGNSDETKEETLVENGVPALTETPVALDTVITPGAAPVEDVIYVVAGVPELCVNTWDPSPVTSSDNVMTDNGDGTFSKVYNDVAPMDSYQIKVVENIGEAQNWVGIGPEY